MTGHSPLNIVLYRMRKPFLVLIITFSISMIGLLLIDGVDKNGDIYRMSIFDAFYFVTYTATTIGFGESPFEFTYSQRLWVSFTVYLTVLGWFYSIGTLISILQDKVFLLELSRGKFKRHVASLSEKYIIVLGYNHTTNEIIKRILAEGYRVIVIEKDEKKANELHFEGHTPYVPVLVADAFNSQVFLDAGIESRYCKAVVSVFADANLNLRVALAAKLLNKNVILAVKATTQHDTDNLMHIDVNIIKNPFKIVSSHMELAIKAPNLLKLERWLHGQGGLNLPITEFPKGKYIICGYGRFGKYMYDMLKKNKMDVTFIEIKDTQVPNMSTSSGHPLSYGAKEYHTKEFMINDADDKDNLIKAGIKEASVLLAGTDNDTVNLSIIATSKKLNPNLITIARENEMDDFSIFHNAKIDYIFIPANTLINNISNALINPLIDKLVNQIFHQDDEWGQHLVVELIKQIGANPLVHNLTINEPEAPEIITTLENKRIVTLELFHKSLRNHTLNNNVIPLLLLRDKEYTLLPKWDIELKEDDKILFACDENAKDDIEYIAQNGFEFHYAYTGIEKTRRTMLKKNKDI